MHLVATVGGLPIGFALTGAKADERQTLLSILAADPALVADRPGQIPVAGRYYYGTSFETALARAGLTLLRPARTNEPARPGTRFLRWEMLPPDHPPSRRIW